MAYKENRSLKVYTGTAVSRKTSYRMEYKSQPQIRIQGDWLTDIGFIPGTRMNVHCEKGRLILTVEDTEAHELSQDQ